MDKRLAKQYLINHTGKRDDNWYGVSVWLRYYNTVNGTKLRLNDVMYNRELTDVASAIDDYRVYSCKDLIAIIKDRENGQE